MWILLVVFISHWLGDFCLQTQYMADNKSKNHLALLWHVGVYITTISLPILIIAHYAHVNHYIVWIMINLVFHLFTDAFTSRLTAKYHAEGNMKAFFRTLGFDQLLHQSALTLTTLTFLN